MKLRYRSAVELAKKIASCSSLNYKIGCVLTDKKDNLLVTGVNRVQTHPKQALAANRCGMGHKIYLHAEIDALRQLRDWMNPPHNAYIVRVIECLAEEEDHWIMRIAKPCRICSWELSNNSSVKEIFYSTNNNKMIKLEGINDSRRKIYKTHGYNT